MNECKSRQPIPVRLGCLWFEPGSAVLAGYGGTGFDEARHFRVGAGGGRMGLGKILGGNQMDEGCVFYAVFFIFDFFFS